MRYSNYTTHGHARTDDELGNAVDEIVGLYLALEVAKAAERATLRRKLAAAGFRLNRLAARRRAA